MSDFTRWLYANYIWPHLEAQDATGYETPLSLLEGCLQQQVADGLGIPSRHYQKFEYGAVLPSLENFIALADHFGVSLDYLAGRSEDRRSRP